MSSYVIHLKTTATDVAVVKRVIQKCFFQYWLLGCDFPSSTAAKDVIVDAYDQINQ